MTTIMNREQAAAHLKAAAERLAAGARAAGFVITIEQRPILPPAMGRHEDVVTVYPKRESE